MLLKYLHATALLCTCAATWPESAKAAPALGCSTCSTTSTAEQQPTTPATWEEGNSLLSSAPAPDDPDELPILDTAYAPIVSGDLFTPPQEAVSWQHAAAKV